MLVLALVGASSLTSTIAIVTTTITVIVEFSVLLSPLPLLVSVPLFLVQHALLLGVVHYQLWQPEKLDVTSSDVDLFKLVELLTFVVRNNGLGKGQVHPRVAVGQFANNGFAILQLYENFLAFDAC